MLNRFDDHENACDADDAEVKRLDRCHDAGQLSRRLKLPLSSCLLTSKTEQHAWVAGWTDEDANRMADGGDDD